MWETWTFVVGGLLLGIKHATDTDHLVVVSTMLQRTQQWRAVAWIASLWGLGHSLSFFIIGFLIVVMDWHVPASFEFWTEFAVGIMLIFMGTWHGYRCYRASFTQPSSSPSPVVSSMVSPAASSLRPFVVGSIHGFAGSAGIALFALTTSPHPLASFLAMFAFAVGTIVGMMLVTFLLARSVYTAERVLSSRIYWMRNLQTWFIGAASVMSILLGIWIVISLFLM